MTRNEVLRNTGHQQRTYNLYLCSRWSMFKLTLSRTSGLQQPPLRHQQEHSQDHTLWRPRMESVTRGIGDSSNQLRTNPHLVKQQTMSFPAAKSWSSPEESSNDLRDILRLCNFLKRGKYYNMQAV